MKKIKLSSYTIPNLLTNGINGKSVSYYDHRMNGLGVFADSITQFIANANNSNLTTGIYITEASPTNNMPNPYNYVLIVIAKNQNLTYQFAYDYNRKFYRRSYYMGSGWSAWVDMKKDFPLKLTIKQ